MNKEAPSKAAWLSHAGYGFFYHFLNHGTPDAPPEKRSPRFPAEPEEWNRIVDGFDVKTLARQLHELNAGYFFLTVGQNSGYYCSPNRTYDNILGREGLNSKCSHRDLISDLADALARYDIPLLGYTTTQAPGFDLEAVEKLKSIPPWDNNGNCRNYDEVRKFAVDDPRLREFQKLWNAIHTEWTLRWGSKLKGWWVDGSFYGDKMYDFPDEPNGDSFLRALRAGNPDAIVALCAGPSFPPRQAYPGAKQDFTAGEMPRIEYGLMEGPSVCDGLQYHILSCAGTSWGTLPLRFDGREMAALTRNITDNGGAVTWDVPCTPQGIQKEVFATLHDFAVEYRRSIEELPPVYVRIDPPQYNAQKSPVPGRAELTPSRPFKGRVTWNGHNYPLGDKKRSEIDLMPQGNLNQLKIEGGSFQRSIPVLTRRSFVFGPDLSNPATVLCDEKTQRPFASFRFACREGIFHIEAEIAETCAKTVSDDAPWNNSCFELFLAESNDSIHWQQLCFEHSCRCSWIVDCIARPFQPEAFDIERSDGKTLIRIAVRPKTKGGRFVFDIQETAWDDSNHRLHGTLFGAAPHMIAAFAETAELKNQN